MKKYIWMLLGLIFISSNFLAAQIENYTKEDIAECLILMIRYPDFQEAMQKDINYQDEFDVTLGDRYVRYSPLRKLIQQIDDSDLSYIDNRLYLERQNRSRYNNSVAEEDQRRRMGFSFQHDEIEDAFVVVANTERLIHANKNISYIANFKLVLVDDEWQVEMANVNKSNQR